jgi:hypothetical protein
VTAQAPGDSVTDAPWVVRSHPVQTVLIALLTLAVTVRFVLFHTDTLFVLAGDARNAWIPLATTVADGGTPYVDFADNKPPLFIILVLLAHAIHFTGVLFFATLLSEIAITIEIRRWMARLQLPGRTVATILVASGFIHMHMNYAVINNKAISVAVLLIALSRRRPLSIAVGLATACLFAQQIVVAIPAIMWYRLDDLRGTVRFLAGGLSTALGGYLGVAAIWNVDAAIAAFRQSALIPAYVAGTSEFGRQLSLWRAPSEWVVTLARNHQSLLVPSIFAVFGLCVLLRSPRRAHFYVLSVTVAFGALLLVRPWWHYAYFPIVPLSVLGGVAVAGLDA